MSKRAFQIGPGVTCDLDRLVNTRLLVQANSGAGKSWALRRLLEQTHGKIQHLVIDPEGEFSSLRTHFDYVLAARNGGDTLADPRTAKLLAERLLELGVSAILDIYELKPHERIAFVKTFLDALVEAPKALWHPVLVVLDEAHVYCPEKGHGEADSADAVKSLATRGRKRGFCLIPATQRLSKLHKDVAAECNNKLIGRCSLDVDMKRAAYELGFTTQEQRLQLRDLKAGEFFAFGPALTNVVTAVTVGGVKTEHPKAGSKLAAVVPPPSDKVKELLPKLSDLPAEAEAREKTVADLKRELANTRRELTEAKKAQPPAPKTEIVDKPVLSDADRALLEKLAGRISEIRSSLLDHRAARLARLKAELAAEMESVSITLADQDAAKADEVSRVLDSKGFQKILDKLATVKTGANYSEIITNQPNSLSSQPFAGRRADPPARAHASSRRPSAAVSHDMRRAGVPSAPRQPSDGDSKRVTGCASAILAVLAQHPDGCRKGKLALLAGYPYNGSFRTRLSELRTAGFIVGGNEDVMQITDTGLATGPYPELPATGDERAAYWLSQFSGQAKAILDALLQHPAGLTSDQLAEATGYPWNGSFRTRLSELRTAGVVVGKNTDVMRASEELFS